MNRCINISGDIAMMGSFVDLLLGKCYPEKKEHNPLWMYPVLPQWVKVK